MIERLVELLVAILDCLGLHAWAVALAQATDPEREERAQAAAYVAAVMRQ